MAQHSRARHGTARHGTARHSLISTISTAKEDLPSRGESAEKFRSMKASVYGTVADCTGAYRPQADKSATAQTLRRMVDFPAMLGPAEASQLNQAFQEERQGCHTVTVLLQRTVLAMLNPTAILNEHTYHKLVTVLQH